MIFPTDSPDPWTGKGCSDSSTFPLSSHSVESIVKHLEQYAETFSLRRISSSLNLDQQRTKIERRSASLSEIDIGKVLGAKAETNKMKPSDNLLATDQYIR